MASRPAPDPSLSLARLMDPAVLADPYPLYARLREEAPVHWDPFLHCWVVTRYADVHQVLHSFSADRTPSPEQLRRLGIGDIEPIAELMVKQMLFFDPPRHTQLRKLCSTAFTPRRVELLEQRIVAIADRLIDRAIARGRMDVINDFAAPFPAIVFAALLGVPEEDHAQLKIWSADFAEMLGNFQHNVERVGIGEARGIAVAGGHHRHHRGPLGDQRAAHEGILVCDAPGVLRRRFETQELLDRARRDVRPVAKLGELVGLPQQREQARSDQVGGGLLAADHHDDGIGDDFVL
jgi:hypothetical protein